MLKPSQGSTFRVRPFTFAEFCAALGREPNDTHDVQRPLPEDIEAHEQACKLYTYLAELSPRTIVVEETYVDRDYLADYTSFYATVFARFDRFCKRVHFFSQNFTENEFLKYVLGTASKAKHYEFVESYLGFTVVRPLPEALVGRTVVKTYPKLGNTRRYRAVLDTKVELFGMRLTVPDSLPFQQQDSVVAACATVALWSAFHKAADLFGTESPRPAEITMAATAKLYQERTFSSGRLTLEQICEAIRSYHLEAEVFRLEQKHVPVLSWIRSYLEMGLPVILGLKFPNGDLHAVTTAGYRVEAEAVRDRETSADNDIREAPSFGRRITELYCHDDNICPFARYNIEMDPNGGNLKFVVHDSVYQTGGSPWKIDLDSVVVPIYRKIRLDFPAVQSWVTVLDLAIEAVLLPDIRPKREWDVSLIASSDAKSEIRSLAWLTKTQRAALLVSPQPRYLWKVILRAGSTEVLRLYADATSFRRSVPIRRAIFARPQIRKHVLPVLEEFFGRDDYGEQARALQHFLAGERLEPEP